MWHKEENCWCINFWSNIIFYSLWSVQFLIDRILQWMTPQACWQGYRRCFSITTSKLNKKQDQLHSPSSVSTVHIFKISKECSFLVSFALIKKENLQSTIIVPKFEKENNRISMSKPYNLLMAWRVYSRNCWSVAYSSHKRGRRLEGPHYSWGHGLGSSSNPKGLEICLCWGRQSE